MNELATADPLTPEETEASAQLLEHQTEPRSTRRSTGLRVVPERKATIYALFDAGGLSYTAIADRLGMNRATVSAILRHRESDAALARNVLGSNSIELARNWLTAAKQGARRGRHEPARDALYALGVVSPPQQSQQHQQVTVVLSGGEMPTELRIGVQQTQARAPDDE